MRILFLGDIMGKAGRIALERHLPNLKRTIQPDVTIVNGENAAHGFGITPAIADDFFAIGVDVITGGNHSWDKAEIFSAYESEAPLLTPHNQSRFHPGKGHYIHETEQGKRVLILNLMGRVFMEPCRDPFEVVDSLLPLGVPMEFGFDSVIVDFHAETTAEKYCMGHFCDGRATLVVGTHTHVPTADHHILEHGTAFQCDAGMCGDYNSSIGMDKHSTLDRMIGKIPKPRLRPAEGGEASICGLVVDSCPETGLALKINAIRQGGMLSTLTFS